MTTIDLIELIQVMPYLPNVPAVLLSPTIEQLEVFRRRFDRVDVMVRGDWDIEQPSELRTGLIYLANVLMYVPAPKEAINNMLESCQYLMIQDVIRRKRGPVELGVDGDCTRFSFGGERARIEGYDLAYLNPVFYRSYTDGEALHFIMIVKK